MWQIERDGMRVVKFETTQMLHFLNGFFAAVAVVAAASLKLPILKGGLSVK